MIDIERFILKGLAAGKMLEGLDRVNSVTMFLLNCAKVFPTHTDK